MSRCTSRRYYSLVNFKQPLGRNHWPSCWHGSYGIIDNPLQYLNLLWIHIALSTPMIYTLCYGQIWRISSQLFESSEDSGATMTWLRNLDQFQLIQEAQVVGGNITRSRRLLPYWWKSKRPSEKFRLTMMLQVYNPVQGKSRLPHSPEALKIRFKIRIKRKLSPTKLWSSQYLVQNTV